MFSMHSSERSPYALSETARSAPRTGPRLRCIDSGPAMGRTTSGPTHKDVKIAQGYVSLHPNSKSWCLKDVGVHESSSGPELLPGRKVHASLLGHPLALQDGQKQLCAGSGHQGPCQLAMHWHNGVW
jgi:hypothetical protein